MAHESDFNSAIVVGAIVGVGMILLQFVLSLSTTFDLGGTTHPLTGTPLSQAQFVTVNPLNLFIDGFIVGFIAQYVVRHIGVS